MTTTSIAFVDSRMNTPLTRSSIPEPPTRSSATTSSVYPRDGDSRRLVGPGSDHHARARPSVAERADARGFASSDRSTDLSGIEHGAGGARLRIRGDRAAHRARTANPGGLLYPGNGRSSRARLAPVRQGAAPRQAELR